MFFERITSWALAVVLTIASAHLSAARAAEIFGGRVADEVTLPGECAGNLQPAEGLPLRPALIRFSVSPDGQWLAVSCELSSGSHAVFVGRQGVWRRIDTKEPLFLRAWTTNGRGLWMPFPASLRLTNRALWFTNFQVGAFSHPAKISNGAIYYSPLASGAVAKVFERPDGGQFAFASHVVPSRDDVVVMAGFASGKLRTIRVTPDGKSEFLPVTSDLVPLFAAPLGPSGDYLTIDGSGKAAIGEKAVTGLPQRESVLFAASGRAFVFPAGDNLEIHEVLPTGSLSSLIFPATARPVQPGAASSAGLLVEGGGFLDSREFDTLYLGNSRLVKTGDVVLGVRIVSFNRHSTAIDDNGDVYFAPSGLTSRVFRLSSPRVVSVSPSTVSQGQDFVVTGDSLWIPGGPKTDLVLGAGAPVDACSARSSGELVCSSKNFPLGDLTFRVRISDGKNFPLGSQPARLTVLPPPAIAITGFTLSRPSITRGETVDTCFQTSEAPSDGWFLSFKGAKTGANWGIGIGSIGQTNQVLARSATMDNMRVNDDRTCVSSRPEEDGEFQLLVGARGFRASAGPLPISVEVPKPRLTACEGEPSAVMPMQGTERLTPGGLARFCGEFLDGASVEFLSGFTEAGETLAEALETLTTTSTEVVAKLPQLAGEIWIRVAREGLVSDWASVQIAQPPPPETPEPAPEPAPEPGEVP